MTVLVEAKKVSKVYQVSSKTFWKRPVPFTAVEQVSLSINKGETVGLIGESGSGKSTLGRMLARLIIPSSGSICFDGADITHLRQKEITPYYRRLQLIFQDSTSSLNPRRPIGEQILSPIMRLNVVDSRLEGEKKVLNLLEKVGLKPEHFLRYPHEFSGGQRQRIGIARALAVDPEFLILDEPTSALDVSIQAQIINLLLDLREEYNLTYLFISHNISIVEFFCDRIVVMERGNIVDSRKAEDLQSSTHPTTRKLLDSVLSLS